jgi:acyl carrier protein
MMPDAIQVLPALPLGPNGKIDRAALPVPAPSRPELERQYVAPRGAVERVVAAVWADVLRLDRVGIADEFFALGGHSLLATQVVARLQEIFQVAIPLASFLEVPPTVADAARLLLRHEVEAGRTERIAAIWEHVQAMSPEDVDAALDGTPEIPRT